MTETTKQTIEIDVPVGFRVVRYGKIPRGQPQTKYLTLDRNSVVMWGLCENSSSSYFIVEPDPSYIDTTAEEYRIEVYRQWLRGKNLEQRISDGRWIDADGSCLAYKSSTARIKPEGTDERGDPYYVDGDNRRYLPK